MPKYRKLSGLPGAGPLPVSFPGGKISHSEGFVVEFETNDGDRWFGNFGGGLSIYSALFTHPDGSRVVVIAGGACYIVDPESRESEDSFSGCITAAYEMPKLNMLILQTPISFIALSSEGISWETERIAENGFRDLQFEESKLIGEAWFPVDGPWHKFELDLHSGKVTGGAGVRDQDKPKDKPWWKLW
jgi:hypothetical protein